ncbi:MAG TPA: MOSC N-terminal beta barrel domain-containing protein [Pseudonocardiaceae bacterium]
MPRVVELTSYPVKGCAGVAVPATVVGPAGPAHDRAFMVVGPGGLFRSQRRDPGLALVRPAIDPAGELLTLSAPGAGPITVPVRTAGRGREVTLFTWRYRGVDQGDAVAAWLTEVLDAPSRLVRVPEDHDRVVEGETVGTSGYADSGALHLTSRTSLAQLNARVAARGDGTPPVAMSRFRPNVVLDGWPEPHREDDVRRATLGDVELGFCKHAVRCSVALVDQEAGRRAGPEPLRTLATYRRARPKGVTFGVKFAVTRPGKISVGDELNVLAWAR